LSAVAKTSFQTAARCAMRGQARQILRRPEFNGDVLLRLDRPLVQKSRRVTPLANGAHGCRKKRERAAHELYTLDLAELSDGGADLYGF